MTSRPGAHPGVGRCIAERLVIEMRDRIRARGPAAVAGTASAGRRRSGGDCGTAWLPSAEAARLPQSVAAEDVGTEDLIRCALQASVGLTGRDYSEQDRVVYW